MCKKTPSIVYKYYSMDKAAVSKDDSKFDRDTGEFERKDKDSNTPRSVQQLLDKSISFTNIETMNDPCEAVSKFIYPTNSEMNKCEYHLYKKMDEHTSNMIQMVAKSLAVFCVSETPMNPLMWSHYAQAYQGFCVGYAVEDITNRENEVISFEKVNYNKKLFDFGKMPIRSELLEKKLIELLSHKSCCWSYEREWRAICRGEKLRDVKPQDTYDESTEMMLCVGEVCQIYKKYISKSCLAKEIYLGYKMPEEYRMKIINFCQTNHIQCYNICPSSNSYDIEKESIISFGIND